MSDDTDRSPAPSEPHYNGPTPVERQEKARREDLRATLAAAAYAVRIQQGAGNTTNGGDRRKYAATEAVADADALLSALGR